MFVTSAVPCSFWSTSMNSTGLGCAFRAIFLGNHASLQCDCALAIVVEVVPHPKREMAI